MRVAVAGAATSVGRCAVPVLEEGGHEVVVLDRAGARPSSLLDVEALRRALEGCDALVSLLLPGGEGMRPGHHPALRWAVGRQRPGAATVRALVDAARAAGVRRVVQQSVSFLYADQGEEWITERSPVCVTPATEPASEGELVVEGYTSACRTGVVLRFGAVLGDSGLSRRMLRAVARGRPVSGSAAGFTPVVHTDDVGPAVRAALSAPSGIYNVGAAPVRRGELVAGCAEVVGRPGGDALLLSPRAPRLGSRGTEPVTRSLRVSSSEFQGTTGWSPVREAFDASWLTVAGSAHLVLR